jgi:hypothetical protein
MEGETSSRTLQEMQGHVHTAQQFWCVSFVFARSKTERHVKEKFCGVYVDPLLCGDSVNSYRFWAMVR